MTHVPEIGAENRYQKTVPISSASDMHLVPNVSGIGFRVRVSALISGRCVIGITVVKIRDCFYPKLKVVGNERNNYELNDVQGSSSLPV